MSSGALAGKLKQRPGHARGRPRHWTQIRSGRRACHRLIGASGSMVKIWTAGLERKTLAAETRRTRRQVVQRRNTKGQRVGAATRQFEPESSSISICAPEGGATAANQAQSRRVSRRVNAMMEAVKRVKLLVLVRGGFGTSSAIETRVFRR